MKRRLRVEADGRMADHDRQTANGERDCGKEKMRRGDERGRVQWFLE